VHKLSVVLIVEDEELERDFLKTVVLDELLPQDTLLTCESGLRAIQLAKEYRPNIVIMDLLLPEVNGLTVIQEIRKFLPHACITILSAYSDFSYAQKAISFQVFDYLLKPIKPTVFKETFLRMLKAANKNGDAVPLKGDSIAEEPKDDRQGFIEEAVAYINEHFREKLTLETVASKVYMNPKYFSHVFKKETGYAFTEYVTKLRIQHACRLLETTNFKAYRISLECGFSDPSYFNRVFYAQMNMTPQAYRKHILSGKFNR